MEEERNKEDYQKERKTIEDCITNHGIVVDGMGAVMNHLKKQVEILDKIQRFLFFMEKRQQSIETLLNEKLK